MIPLALLLVIAAGVVVGWCIGALLRRVFAR